MELNQDRRGTYDPGGGVGGMLVPTSDGSFSAVPSPISATNLVKTHVKALAESYTIHTFAPISDLKISI